MEGYEYHCEEQPLKDQIQRADTFSIYGNKQFIEIMRLKNKKYLCMDS